MKKIAVILAGNGVYDGSEIHEAVLTLLAIEQNDAQWECFAPDIEQLHVINHKTGEVSDETRNVLVESARIARGNISDLADLEVSNFDALIVPGGFGVAKNLTDFAVNGAECSINTFVASACRSFAESGKPAGYLCIAPTIIPMIYAKGVKATIGHDPDTAAAFNSMGGEHVECNVADIVYDENYNVYSTPAYMEAKSISEAATGINKLVKALIKSIK
ncbi:isoprenoid biosynthesis glyoxalase ElbB [Vibrio sp.]|nr:isoprenoid biosynthesis glyoxalase ElbB [Vibrio sp.]